MLFVHILHTDKMQMCTQKNSLSYIVYGFGLFQHLTFCQETFRHLTFHHGDFLAREHFVMKTFWHGYFLAHGHFGTGAPLPKCLYWFAQCQNIHVLKLPCAEISLCQNVPVPKCPWCRHIPMAKCSCAEMSPMIKCPWWNVCCQNVSCWNKPIPERIYNPITAMGFSAMFTFQLDNTKR